MERERKMKSMINKLLKLYYINYALGVIVRFFLQSRILSFPVKQLLENKVCWALFPCIDKFRCNLYRGRKILLAGSFEHREIVDMYWWGRYAHEPETFLLFWKLAKKSTRFFDVGANVGWYSLVAQAANPALSIVAFEPNPSINSICRNNMQLNGFSNIILEQYAVADRETTVDLYIPFDTISSASMNPHFRSATKTIKVPSKTIDGYLNERKMGFPDLVKIDTETTEPLVIEGMKRVLIDGNPVILCEILDSSDMNKLTDILKPLGYRFFFITRNRLIEMSVIQRDNTLNWKSYQKTPYFNFLFSRKTVTFYS